MSQDASSNNVPGEFTFRTWKPSAESWDDYLRASERAYALYVNQCQRTSGTEQPPPPRSAQDPQDPLGQLPGFGVGAPSTVMAAGSMGINPNTGD